MMNFLMTRVFLITLTVFISCVAILPASTHADIDPPAITGLIFVDKNGNTTRDESEVGVANTSVTIYVDNVEPSSSPEACTPSMTFGNEIFDDGEVFETSSDSGFYELAPILEPTDSYPYCVTIRREINHTYQSIITNTLDVYYNILIDDENDLEEGYDFAATANGAFSGYAWRDENADGIKDDKEPLLELLEVVATPITALGGATSTSATRTYGTTTSDAAGAYDFEFTPQQFGYWRFTFTLIPGLALTSANHTYETYIGSGDDIYAQNFGFAETAIITDDPFVASGGQADNTTAAKPLNTLSQTIISIDDKLGSSTILLSFNTIITESSNTPFNLNEFESQSMSESELSNTPTNIFVASIQFGIDALSLLLSIPAQIFISVDSEWEGSYLYIYRSDATTGPWVTTGLSTTTCLVMQSTCSFTSTHAGYFIIMGTTTSEAPKTPELEVPSTPIVVGGGGAPVGLLSGDGTGSGSIVPTFGTVLGAATSTSSTTNTTEIATASSTDIVFNVMPVPLPPNCGEYLAHNMGFRYQNDLSEVKKLQQFLNIHHKAKLPETGYFGMLTFTAVKNLQADKARDILYPLGLTEPTGFAGEMTRLWINKAQCLTTS